MVLSAQQISLKGSTVLCCCFPQGHSASLAGCLLAGRVQAAGTGRATWRALQQAAGACARPAGGAHATPRRATAQTASWSAPTVTSQTGIATIVFTHAEAAQLQTCASS